MKEGIKCQETIVDYVEDFTYLGQLVSFGKRAVKEIQRRSWQGWKKFWSLKNIMKGGFSLKI